MSDYWITDQVKLPQAVLDAQEADRLVFFVGAGASVAPPSGLPLFNSLAAQLAERADVSGPTSGLGLDSFLGGFPNEFDTHRHTQEIIARSDSQPNQLHRSIIEIARRRTIRIVTTNFDTHLTTAAKDAGLKDVDVWRAPALPPGDKFTGIVHLHGAIDRPPHEMVLTDTDFGKAYLTEYWATRFLLAMFSEYTVVFVGYSHEDPIMRYLALGLPSGKNRFAFTGQSPNTKEPLSRWQQININEIPYPVINGDHSELGSVLASWAKLSSANQTEHAARMTEIVSGGPVMSPTDRSYIMRRLNTMEGVIDFTRAVSTSQLPQSLDNKNTKATNSEEQRKLRWLEWLCEVERFKSYFAGAETEPWSLDDGLIDWFCREYITSPQLNTAALHVAMKLGTRFNERFYFHASWAAEELIREDEEAGRRWKAFLATSIQGISAPGKLKMLLECEPSRLEHRALIRAALRPYLKESSAQRIRESLLSYFAPSDKEEPTLPSPPLLEVAWPVEDNDSLSAHLQKAVEAAEPGDWELRGLLEAALHDVYRLVDAYGQGTESCLASYGMQIATAAKGEVVPGHRNSIDIIVAALRDFGVKALPVIPDLPESWWATGRELFQRLAVYLVSEDGQRTADQKILWLLERGDSDSGNLFYDLPVSGEARYLLVRAATGLSEGVRTQLLKSVKDGPSKTFMSGEAIEKEDSYEVYKLLICISEENSGLDWPELTEAIKDILQTYPLFASSQETPPSPVPWIQMQPNGLASGDLEVFTEHVRESAADTLRVLCEIEPAPAGFCDPVWKQTTSVVEGMAAKDPKLGYQLWQEIDKQSGASKRVKDLRLELVKGWDSADLGSHEHDIVDCLGSIVSEIGASESEPVLAHHIGYFLLQQIEKRQDSGETPTLAGMRKLACDLWRHHARHFEHEPGREKDHFFTLALNTWPGYLAQFWILEVSRRWREYGDAWQGLNRQERIALLMLLRRGTAATDNAVHPAIGGMLYFLFEADETFALKYVLPLFRGGETSIQVWATYLHQARCNNRLLANGLLDCMKSAWGYVEQFESHIQGVFFDLVMQVVGHADINEDQRKALLWGSVTTAGGNHAPFFAYGVVRFLREENGAFIWKQWLREHVHNRLQGTPRNAAPIELSGWADAVPYLGEAIPEAVEMFRGQEVGFTVHPALGDIPEETVSQFSKLLTEHFVQRIRDTPLDTQQPKWRLSKVIKELDQKFGDPIRKAAQEKGLWHE